MTDVLIATSYFLKFDPKQTQKMKPYSPLAALWLAATLRQRGYTVALFDAMLSDGEHAFAAMLESTQPRAVVLFEDNFNFLSKMCLTRMRDAACSMIGMARAVGCPVLAAGSDVTDHPHTYLQAGADAVAVGEGDHSAVEWLGVALGADGARPTLAAIDGLVYLENGVLTRSAKRAPERQPDVFPLPAWDMFEVEKYRKAWTDAHGYFSLNMASTRGCPFHCNWCAKPIWGQRYAMRTPANVAEELALVKRTLNPDHIWFADDIFGLRPHWVVEFAREVRARDAAIPFMIQSRADLMTEQAVDALRDAGCVEVWLGAESGSQQILDAMDKGTSVEQIYTARERLKNAGIKACFFIQFGYPGENWDNIQATFGLVKTALPDNIGISVSYPLPNTRFYDMVRNQLGEKTNWTDSDELAMMFRGAYRTPFYKKLHTVLHLYHDRHRGLAAPAFEVHWDELLVLEREQRNTDPTLIVKTYDAPEVPDLSKTWN
jgi:anaerobic magnesium-protoporphyrin IX monomethyl ester cyclase